MSELDAATAVIPLWITLTAIGIGAVLGWCARAVIAERRLMRPGMTERDSDDVMALADAVAEPRPYAPEHDVLHPDREHDQETGGRHERH